MKNIIAILVPALAVLIYACEKEQPEVPPVYDSTPYSVDLRGFPDPGFPADNVPTNAGV